MQHPSPPVLAPARVSAATSRARLARALIAVTLTAAIALTAALGLSAALGVGPAAAESVYPNPQAGFPHVSGAPARPRHFDRRDLRPGYRPGERPGHRPGADPGIRPGAVPGTGSRTHPCPPGTDCIRTNR